MGTSYGPLHDDRSATHSYWVADEVWSQHTCFCALHLSVGPHWIFESAGPMGTSTVTTSLIPMTSLTVTSVDPPVSFVDASTPEESGGPSPPSPPRSGDWSAPPHESATHTLSKETERSIGVSMVGVAPSCNDR